MEQQLCHAIRDRKVEEVERILRENPAIDVNWKEGEWVGYTAIHIACRWGQDSILAILLAHPDIDVNVKDSGQSTPFMLGCSNGQTSCVRLLLKDSRVDVNEPDNVGYTPLKFAAYRGQIDVIKCWIASGREMDPGKRGYEQSQVATLLNGFWENPEKIRHQVRLELGWYDPAAAGVFAFVVFVSYGLLRVKHPTITPAARFFSIASQLPLELQMVLPPGGLSQGNYPWQRERGGIQGTGKDTPGVLVLHRLAPSQTPDTI